MEKDIGGDIFDKITECPLEEWHKFLVYLPMTK